MEKKNIFYRLLKNKTVIEIIKFGIVGVIATIVDYIVMGGYEYILDPKGFNSFFDIFTRTDIKSSTVLVGTSLGFLAGLLVNYLCSISFVYNEKGFSKTKRGFIIFTILSVIGLGISNLGMYLLYSKASINQWISRIVMTIIVMCYNYISKRLIIFKKKAGEVSEEN